MLQNFLDFIKYLFSKETRENIKSLKNIHLIFKEDWKKYTKALSGKFNGDNWLEITVFTNILFDKIIETGISKKKFERFNDIYTELINNCFNHGILTYKDYKISIKCYYSRWYIKLELKQNNGFNIIEYIGSYSFDKKRNIHGIDVIYQLSDVVQHKNNTTTIAVAGDERIEILEKIIYHKDIDILEITLIDNPEWNFLRPNLETLWDRIEKVNYNLYLIIFNIDNDKSNINISPFHEKNNTNKDISRNRVSTDVYRGIKTAVNKFTRSYRNKKIAMVIDSSWIQRDSINFETYNIRVFLTRNDALDWLI